MVASAQKHQEGTHPSSPSFQQNASDGTNATSRYARHFSLAGFGEQAQCRLKASRVLIVGAGGLGSPVLSYLAAAGVGHLIVVDDDCVDLSNLQRQVLHRETDLGVPKVTSAKRFITQLNSDVTCEALEVRLTAATASDLIAEVDCVVDCTDNFATRYLLNDLCMADHVPFVWASIMEFSGQMSVARGSGPCYRCLFPLAPAPGTVPSCGEAGVLGVLPGVMGSLQASETIKVLTGVGESLAERVLLFDALTCAFDELPLRKDPACSACGDGTAQTHVVVPEVTWETVNPDAYVIDVREEGEMAQQALTGATFWPLQAWGDATVAHIMADARGRQIVAVCASGQRSRQAAAALIEAGANAVSVHGGMATR